MPQQHKPHTTQTNQQKVNLHVFGFELLAPADRGSVGVRYRRVECAPVDPLTIHIDAYRATAGGWLRLALKNVAGDAQIASIELAPAVAADLSSATTFFKPEVRLGGRAHRSASSVGGAAGGVWRRMNNMYGAAWELNGVPAPPLHMRITNAAGRAIVIADAITRAGELGDIETHAQFLTGPYAKAGSSSAPLTPPPGAALAPGTTDVLVFHGPDDGGVGGSGGGGGGDGNATTAVAPMSAPAVEEGAGGEGAASAGKRPATAEGPGGNATTADDPAGTYEVAGFEDADGDGIADKGPTVVGMPAASQNATEAAGAAGKPIRRLLQWS